MKPKLKVGNSKVSRLEPYLSLVCRVLAYKKKHCIVRIVDNLHFYGYLFAADFGNLVFLVVSYLALLSHTIIISSNCIRIWIRIMISIIVFNASDSFKNKRVIHVKLACWNYLPYWFMFLIKILFYFMNLFFILILYICNWLL